ncbi:MAG: fumarylacetoacetate hydrolase family protein [Clostridia bacterium]|nr:fumarylacetoacetate hydrolase family protein [Clostridia bacterium]
MHLYTVQSLSEPEKAFPALLTPRGFLPLRALGCDCEDMSAVIRSFSLPELKELALRAPSLPNNLFLASSDARILAPIPHPAQDIICVGLNYHEHIDETAHVEDFTHKEATVYFSKHADRVLGPGEAVPVYDFVDSLDYEVELGVILGSDIRAWTPSDPWPIFGYTVFNDLSARNLQFLHKQWFLGKSLDGLTAMGPCIVTSDEIPSPQSLEIRCLVNGEERQHSNTRYMITPLADILCELSRGMTLRKGTIIATGTPGGVALGMENPQYLKKGDRVLCEIVSIGVLENPVG